MKQDIHPTYYETKINCACGNSWVGGGTISELKLDICSSCHPFYTGKQKNLDTTGRIERFMKRAAASKKDVKPTEVQETAN